MLTTSVTLLERVRERSDQLAWGRFVELYTPLLFRWGQRAGLDSTDAADLVQDVLMVLMKELPDFQYDVAKKNFRGWLKTITINKCREQQRKRRLPVAGDGAIELHDIAGEQDLEAFWQEEYQQHLVHRALEVMRTEFEESTWRACWQLLVEGQTAKEVAEQLGMTTGAVYVAKSRVLRRLRQELGGLLE